MSEGMPRISFCMSTYKRPAILAEQLKCLLAVVYDNIEIIISDNDPDQSARQVIELANDNRIKYFPNRENLGMIKSFNKSIERSSGEYIVMITDDDPVYPGVLMTLLNLQKEFPGYGMYMGGCDWFCVDHKIGKLYNFKVGTNTCLSSDHDIDHKQAYKPGEFLKQIFSFGIFPHYLWSTAIVKKEVLIKMGGVPDYGTPFLGDYAYIAAIGADSGCVIINRSLGCQTLHGENFGRNQNAQLVTAAENFPAFIENKASHLPEWPDIRRRMLRFVGLWVVSHMSFLHGYYKKTKTSDESFREAEKKIFKISYLRKYKTKYYMKKRFPGIHDFLVRVKRSLSSK